jgi:hypothetical protein
VRIQSDGNSGKTEQATQTFLQAIDLAAQLNMKPLLAHCHMGLARYHIKLGEEANARSEIATAAEMYRSLNMNFWLPEAEEILREQR